MNKCCSSRGGEPYLELLLGLGCQHFGFPLTALFIGFGGPENKYCDGVFKEESPQCVTGKGGLLRRRASAILSSGVYQPSATFMMSALQLDPQSKV